MKISLQTPCPACHEAMQIHSLHCRSCDVTVAGEVQTNEFAQLSADDLQFLRVFLKAEGRIREMEGPLGLSYPTIRTRLAQLKDKVFSQAGPALATQTETTKNESMQSPLDRLERGELDFDEALKLVQQKKKKR